MNCTELDDVFDNAEVFFLESDAGFAVAIVALLLVSGVLLAKGEHLARTIGAVASAAVTAIAVFVLTGVSANDMECTARLVVALVSGVFAAVLSLCLFSTGFFLVGAVGLGTVAHYVYDLLPLNLSPVLLGRSGYYYMTLLVAAILGAVASHVQRKHFVRICSSMIGGGGVAWAVHLVAHRENGESAPPLVLLSILALSTLAGTAAQYEIARRKQRRPAEEPPRV